MLLRSIADSLYETTSVSSPVEKSGWDPWHIFWRRLVSGLDIGGLTVELPGGKRLVHRGSKPGPEGVMVMKNWRPLRRLAIEGDIGYAESYIQGDWTSPDISRLIELVAINYNTAHGATSAPLLSRIMYRLRHNRRANTRACSRRNIDRKSTRLNSSHVSESRMPSSA